MQEQDRVLLIDVENSVGSIRAHPDLVRRRIEVLLDAAGPVHHALACYAQDNPGADTLVSVLAELGVAPWPVPSAADAADHALLRHARYVHGRGGRVFTVASGDHRFAVLAELGRVEVLVWEQQPVARALVRAAGPGLRRLPRVTAAQTSPRRVVPYRPAPTVRGAPVGPPVPGIGSRSLAAVPVQPVSSGTARAIRVAAPPSARERQPSQSGSRSGLARAGQGALRAVTTGIGVGVGVGVADLLGQRALHRARVALRRRTASGRQPQVEDRTDDSAV
ncbi:hypothetical protein MXD61_04550 [Frankia sp. AgPm24]|uniref:hypothetical protein n=1 Tax=Frankia sp. AgPm24 TaxID=631128 RepID=UPI00200E441E|nr:hypothetical protein [Frankia sp. AgPm24]MCK9921180.1 hypothetical protein [Frankia sp. AgPm24]